MNCQHCKTGSTIDRRNLCRPCYRDPVIRRMYATMPTNNRGLMSANRNYPLPEPTDCPPGTVEKLLVMCERAERGEQVRHPKDRR